VTRLLALACALVISASAQAPSSRIPRFEDYPAKGIYTGPLAAPKIVTPVQRKYRTRIREGVEKGWGVERDGREQGHPGPNFAGKMIVVQWGCGAPCLMMAMVDGSTGDVYLPPLPVDNTFALPLLCIGNSVSSNPEIAFKQDSRLMVIKATPAWYKQKHPSFAYYYLWQNDSWKLLFREPLD
jgi:hypothetical protein